PLLHTTNCRLLILGDGPERQKLELLAKDAGVEGRVKFLGHVEPDQISRHLLQATIFVRVSRSEGLGNSFLEAMAAGLPVIGTNVGGIPDFLKNYNANDAKEDANDANGLFARVDDPSDLAEKIAFLLEDEKLRMKLGENGRKLVSEKYSWDGIAVKMSSIFQSLNTKYLILNTRLLIATGIYPPDIGGPATYTALLEGELPKRGFAVDHLAFTEYRKKPKIIRHLLYLWDCWKKVKNFDAIYAQDPVSVGLPALLAARLRGKKFFIRVAGDYAWEQAAQRFGVRDTIDDFSRFAESREARQKYPWQVKLLIKIQRFVVGRADLVITPSNYFRKLVGGWTKNPERVKTIHNGIDLKIPNFYPFGTSPAGRQFPIPNKGNKTILSAGRLVPWKGFDFLIKLMANPELSDYKLRIVGDGPDKDRLAGIIKELHLENRVELPGEVNREAILKDYLPNAGIFILNTSFESFSFAVAEAMNAGIPIVATRIGSIPELVEDGKEGILVDPDNKEQILAAIKKISGDSDFRINLAFAAHIKAQEFSIDRTVDNLVKLINEHSG
ncbi:MAG: glycosyltransferase family 4 protein, partial [bacterium]|nr:glycosyltransferase family 4 protein [bacterium]